MAAFMATVQSERKKTNKKMESLLKKLDKLEAQVCKDGGSNEKLLDMLHKKTTLLEKQVQDIDHEQKMSMAFKKNQMQVLVTDIDELIRHKGEFK